MKDQLIHSRRNTIASGIFHCCGAGSAVHELHDFTAVNITGDIMVSCCVDASERKRELGDF